MKSIKKTVGLITFLLIICNISFCYSIVGKNMHKTVINNSYSVSVTCNNNYMTVYPFETAVYGINVKNTGDIIDTYILDCPDLIDCCYWSELNIYETTLNPGESRLIILSVQPYWELEDTYTITVRATSTGDSMVKDSILTFTTVILGNRVIDVSSDKPVYDPGEPVVLSLTNIADEAIEGNPTLEVYNADHELVYGCYPDCWITLAPGESFNDIWIPSVPQGKYTVEGIFLTYEDEYFDDESFFILDDNPIEVTTDKTIYESGEMVNLVMTNIGDSVIAGNPSFLIYNSNEEIMFEVYIYLWLELYPGEIFNEIWWNQKDLNNHQAPDGGYRLIGQLWTSEEEIYLDDYKFYIGENQPPNAPSIDGPTSGKPGTPYTYTFTSALDPDGDDVSYFIEWDDGTTSGWTSFIPSGPPGYSVSHTWSSQGAYTIRAKVKDDYGAESDWGELKVNMPRSREIQNKMFQWFLEQFQILSNLLQRLGLQ